jgi:hypothetical protein
MLHAAAMASDTRTFWRLFVVAVFLVAALGVFLWNRTASTPTRPAPGVGVASIRAVSLTTLGTVATAHLATARTAAVDGCLSPVSPRHALC